MSAKLHKLLKLPAVLDATALCRSTVYQLERDGRFPKRVAIGPRSVAWREDEIAEWIEALKHKASV